MNLTIILFLAFFPILLISILIYHRDKEKEPIHLLLSFFVLGILSCFLVIFLSKSMAKFLPFMKIEKKNMDFLNILLYSFIGVALLEEICKWIIVYFKGYKHKEFEETYDIIIYSVFVSLGFAFCENCFYIINSNAKLLSIILRALSSVPGHTCNAIFMGYHLSMARQFKYQQNKKLEKQSIILSIVVPVILHGIYDFCIMSKYKILIITFFVFIIILYIISIRKIQRISKYNHKIEPENSFCAICGSKLEGTNCSKCNAKMDIYKEMKL